MNVLWLHNYSDRSGGMFMWDIYDALPRPSWIQLEERALPLIRRPLDAIRHGRQARAWSAKFDLVHAQYGSMVGLSARGVRRPYILSLRGSDMYPHPGALGQRLSGSLRMLFSAASARSASAVVVMSHAMRARLRRWRGMRGKPIHVVVDPAGPQFWPDGDGDLQNRMASSSLRIVTASFQANNPIKRLEMVRGAVELCRAVGLTVDIAELTGLTREGVRDAILAGDALALASTHEGWPNIVKEALLLGRPFIATDVSDLARFVDVVPGSQVVEANEVEFALALVDLLALKAARSAALGHLLQFHPAVCSYKHLILYRAYGSGDLR